VRTPSSGARLVGETRRRILRGLERRGPLAVAELGLRWPLTRPLARYVVEALIEEGEIEWVGPARGRAVLRLTDRGHRSQRGGVEAAF
jgi:predicted ArsR family transcriptional regulator